MIFKTLGLTKVLIKDLVSVGDGENVEQSADCYILNVAITTLL